MKKFVRREGGDSKGRGRPRGGSSRGAPRGGSSRGGDRGGYSSRGSRDSDRGGRFSGRESKRGSPNRRDGGMTEVICSECKSKCEVPFKPTSSKPVYCSDCFGKQDKGGSGKSSSKDLEMINKKLDKIMAALKIK
jgi:CxxC-x17-CxxC domain-containing protein